MPLIGRPPVDDDLKTNGGRTAFADVMLFGGIALLFAVLFWRLYTAFNG